MGEKGGERALDNRHIDTWAQHGSRLMFNVSEAASPYPGSSLIQPHDCIGDWQPFLGIQGWQIDSVVAVHVGKEESCTIICPWYERFTGRVALLIAGLLHYIAVPRFF